MLRDFPHHSAAQHHNANIQQQRRIPETLRGAAGLEGALVVPDGAVKGTPQEIETCTNPAMDTKTTSNSRILAFPNGSRREGTFWSQEPAIQRSRRLLLHIKEALEIMSRRGRVLPDSLPISQQDFNITNSLVQLRTHIRSIYSVQSNTYCVLCP